MVEMRLDIARQKFKRELVLRRCHGHFVEAVQPGVDARFQRAEVQPLEVRGHDCSGGWYLDGDIVN